VRRKTGPGTGDSITDAKTVDTLANLNDRSGGTVAHWDRSFEFCLYSRKRAHYAFAPGFIDYFFDEIGAVPGLAEQTLFAKIDFRFFGPGAYQRRGCTDKQMSALHRRRRDFGHRQNTRLHILKDLFHASRL
jgi:hypothetical protein